MNKPLRIGRFDSYYRGFIWCELCERWHRPKAYHLDQHQKAEAISFPYFRCNNGEDYLVFEAKEGIDFLIDRGVPK